MAFKTAKDYNEQRFNGWFLLRNDGDYADVVFLYRNSDDVLVADTHYIKSADYSGYVHCCGKGCPACGKGIRVQTKLFIPLYVLTVNGNPTGGEMQFWDRSMRFEPQLNQDVFSRYADPSEYVFRITRHGTAGDVNTTYEIVAVGRNADYSYDTIMSKFNTSSPACYSQICKEATAAQLYEMINSSATAGQGGAATGGDMPSYQVVPRGTAAAPATVPPSSFTGTPPVEPPVYSTAAAFAGGGAVDGVAAEELDDDGEVNF